MSLSLLEMCERVLDDIGSFEKPTYIVGNDNDNTALSLLAQAKKTGEELVRLYEWQELKEEGTITTADGTALYSLASDFHRVIDESLWNNTQYERILFKRTSSEWTALTKSQVGVDWNDYARIIGDQIEIYPTPSSVETITYEYIQKSYCTSSGGTEQPDGWTADTDLSILPDDMVIAGIKYWFLRANQLPYQMAEDEYYGIVDDYKSMNIPADGLNMAKSVIQPGLNYFNYNFPEVVEE